jgi:hypothetical protein
MQRGRRDDGVDVGLGQCIAPPWVAQVRAHDAHAVVMRERCRRDGEQHRIDVDSDRVRPGQPIEQSAGNRAGATRDVMTVRAVPAMASTTSSSTLI